MCLMKLGGKGVNSGTFSVEMTVTSGSGTHTSLLALPRGSVALRAGRLQRRPTAALGSGGRRRTAAAVPGGLQESFTPRED